MESVNIYGCSLTFAGSSVSGTVSGVTITGIPRTTIQDRDVTQHTDSSKRKRAGRLKDVTTFAFNVLAAATDLLPVGELATMKLRAPYDATSGYGLAQSGIIWSFSGYVKETGDTVGGEAEDIRTEYVATVDGTVAKSGYVSGA